MFIKEKGLYYANGFGSNKTIYPVKEKKDSSTEVHFKIDYEAYW